MRKTKTDLSYPNHLFWTDYLNRSEVLHKTSEKQKEAYEHKNVELEVC